MSTANESPPTQPEGLLAVSEAVWEIPADARADMRVPARVFADRELLDAIRMDRSLEQLQNVATLPGIVEAAMAMPDVHQGYGFPVGGVAATEPPDGVISPGGVGYDINCGVRLLALPLTEGELGDRREALVHEISRQVPAGMGGRGRLAVHGAELDRVLTEGAAAVVEHHGIGVQDDLEHTESVGRLPGADPGRLSDRARDRGAGQLGTMGAGNHFIELQRVERVIDPVAAEAFGLRSDQVTVLIHSGSRGLGHQVCTDYVKRMDAALSRHRIVLPDRQLACAPLSSPEGQAYLGAMSCAANFAWANRQTMAHRVREAVAAVIGRRDARDTRQVYDVAHNVAKLEEYGGRVLCVHRKGATRAFPAGSDEIPADYREIGQPVFIPGSMGTASFVLVGRPGSVERSFGSSCHGAGRRMSRTGARREISGAELRRQLQSRGIVVRCPSQRGLAEEAPFAYKDVDRVVSVVERAGLAAPVVRLVPLGVVKG
ncbi:MAG: RtcB family protein [Solirubrobacterales bacterium]